MDVFLPHEAIPADDQFYTGDAWYTMLSYGQPGSLMQSGMVYFAPGSRTRWHSHLCGQTLVVLEGVALVGTRTELHEVHAGETVECPPGDDHWHGATPEGFMRHLAMWELSETEDAQVDWLEPVSEADYLGSRIRQPQPPIAPVWE